MNRQELVLPDLGLQDVTLSLWLVEEGSPVTVGDRLVEVMADGVTVDISSPASGVLIETLVEEDEPISAGQRLGVIEVREE